MREVTQLATASLSHSLQLLRQVSALANNPATLTDGASTSTEAAAAAPPGPAVGNDVPMRPCSQHLLQTVSYSVDCPCRYGVLAQTQWRRVRLWIMTLQHMTACISSPWTGLHSGTSGRYQTCAIFSAIDNVRFLCSFDLLKDDLGGPRSNFPHTMYVVAGTQAMHASQNYLSLMKLSEINQGRHGSKANNDSDDDMSDDDDLDAPPQINTTKVAHHGGVNRLRCMPQQPTIMASWGDTGLVQVGTPLD